MMWLDREGARTSLVVVLLALTFLLTAFVAVSANRTSIYHRATTERVVRDWTRVAIDELVRRADNQASFYGTYPVLQSLDASKAEFVTRTFRYDLSSGVLEPPDAWLLEQCRRLAATPPRPEERKPLHAMIDGVPRVFAYLIGSDDIRVVEVDVSRLGRFFEGAMSVHPLLPSSLANGRVTNDALSARVEDDRGRLIYTTAGAIDPALGVRRVVEEEGLLRGARVQASLAPRAARLLVGSFPQPQRIYWIILALTGGLLLIAVLQLLKERALVRMRADFVADVSHELRTPLTQIRMFAETLLLDRVRSDQERRRSLTIIDQETRRLAQLVDNVLQFSRGERGTLRVVPMPRDLAEVVRETIELFEPIAAARGVRIVTRFGPDTITPIDLDAMRQVILNLLDNAVKYGPDGGNVVVAIESTASTIRLSVSDEGPGVPSSERKRIWRRYERLQRDRDRAIAGAGIGLSVVSEIVALHGGRVWVEDDARFVIEVPR